MNWMPINERMQPHWDRAIRPMSQGSVHLDTNDMVMVSVMLRRPLADNTNQQRMVVRLVAPGQMRQLPLHMANHQCTVDRHTIFGMRHNYQLRPITLNQRPFDVSILFCVGRENGKREEIENCGKKDCATM